MFARPGARMMIRRRMKRGSWFMGEVVALRSEARRRALAAPPEGPAQILFFLGVRYVREGDDSETRPGGSRRSGAQAPRSRRKKRA
jgi:hypothetical protein